MTRHPHGKNQSRSAPFSQEEQVVGMECYEEYKKKANQTALMSEADLSSVAAAPLCLEEAI